VTFDNNNKGSVLLSVSWHYFSHHYYFLPKNHYFFRSLSFLVVVSLIIIQPAASSFLVQQSLLQSSPSLRQQIQENNVICRCPYNRNSLLLKPTRLKSGRRDLFQQTTLFSLVSFFTPLKSEVKAATTTFVPSDNNSLTTRTKTMNDNVEEEYYLVSQTIRPSNNCQRQSTKGDSLEISYVGTIMETRKIFCR